MPQRQVLIALGANLPSPAGTPERTLRAAARRLESELGPGRLSPLYLTPAHPPGTGPDYVNAAMAFESPRAAEDILALLHAVEAGFARERVRRWGERTLDLDLLACGDEVLPDEAGFRAWQGLPPDDQARTAPDRLILPHPRLQDRGFVLRPLSDVAADWRHPVIGATVAEMLAALPPEALDGIAPLGG